MTDKNILETAIDRLGKPGEVQALAGGIGDVLVATENAEPALYQVAVPEGMRVVDMTADMDKLATKLQPWRRTGTAQITDLESLIAWANRNKGETSALFATITEKPSLLCISDYLGAGEPVIDPTSRDPNASYMRHRAIYNFPLSKEWLIWNAISGEAMEKGAFGEFVEANAKDLLEPTPALLGTAQKSEAREEWELRMIEVAAQLQGRYGQYATLIKLAREFTVNEVSNITTTLNRDTGESSIQFLNEHQQPDGSAISIPNLFMIAIPVFENGAHYRIAVRFRYRKAGQAVKFIFSLHNPDVCFKDAVDEALVRAAAETGLPLFRGSPEQG